MARQKIKPSVFIGSSKEALKLAQRIKKLLGPEVQAEIWDGNIFALGEDTLNNLLRFSRLFDFAILVLNADDKTISRARSQYSPRDNVIFELGLFMGAIGRRRTFAVISPGKVNILKIPSDLLGNTSVFLDSAMLKGHPSYLPSKIAAIRDAILTRSDEAGLSLLPSTGLAIGYFKNFLVPVCKWLEAASEIIIDGAKHDISKDDYDFTVVVPRKLSRASTEGLKDFVKRRKLSQISVDAHARHYPFFVNAALKKSRLQFVDFPTTLRASYEAIRLTLSSDSLREGAHEALLEAKEIENFVKALLIQLKSPEAAGFRNNVHIKYI
jgi:hypothetical protein